MVLLGVVLGFWVYPRVATFVVRRTGLPHPVLLALWAVATVSVIWWLARRPPLLGRVETFLTLSSGMLVGWFVLSIGVAEWRSARALTRSTIVQRLAEPVRIQPGAAVGPKRDIYLIVLDEYANADVTGRLFGFDNHDFLDSLRHLGFVVPVVHSNYAHTFLSLPSLLNGAQIAGLSEEVGRRSVDRTIPDYLVEHNRMVPVLKAQGYRFVFFPSQSWEATQHNRQADLEVQVWHGLDLARELTRTGLRAVLKRTSLLRDIDFDAPRYTREHVTRTFAAIAQIPKVPEPTFTFAHVLSPHDPYVFDASCRPAHRQTRGNRRELEAVMYVAQIQCINQMVLDLVTTLLRTSELPPVILLQGDHGSKTLQFDKAGTAEKITLAAAKERLGAIGAYYLPDRGPEAFGDSVTVVNVLGNVLRYYVGAAQLREPDDLYISVDAAPYAFKQVDFAWLAQEDWSVRLRREEGRRVKRPAVSQTQSVAERR
jgi:hypothetical protein